MSLYIIVFSLFHLIHFTGIGARGGAVVDALRYKPQGLGIDT
jgi:hypothetical protein